MLAGTSRSTPSPVSTTTCLVPPAGQVVFPNPKQHNLPCSVMWHRIQMWEAHLWVRLARWASRKASPMDRPESVAVPCPECPSSPVEVLKKMHSGRRFLRCPQCRAIWAVDIWVLNRPTSLIEPAPSVIAFGPSWAGRPLEQGTLMDDPELVSSPVPSAAARPLKSSRSCATPCICAVLVVERFGSRSLVAELIGTASNHAWAAHRSLTLATLPCNVRAAPRSLAPPHGIPEGLRGGWAIQWRITRTTRTARSGTVTSAAWS